MDKSQIEQHVNTVCKALRHLRFSNEQRSLSKAWDANDARTSLAALERERNETQQRLTDATLRWYEGDLSVETEQLRKALRRASFIAQKLYEMIDRETWRAHGGDDGQGHYEGDYHAEQIAQEIEEWAALAGPQKEGQTC